MKVVLISDHETIGGAAVAASRLATALAADHDVTRLVLFPDGQPHPWRTIRLGHETALQRQLLRLPRRFLPRRFPRPATFNAVAKELRAVLRRLRPDVVNLHNLHGGTAWGWRPELAAVAAEFAPVVWTLHDMWSFTGRCAYSYDCRQFMTGCTAACPTAAEPPALPPDQITAAWAARLSLLRKTPMVAVTPSRWLAAEASRGLWAGHRVEVIPYGVPTDVYRPVPRDEARRKLGVQAVGPVVLLSAHDLTERRKGADLIPAMWPHVRPRPLTLLTMGGGRLPLDVPGVHHHALGWIGDESVRALAYSAADVLLHPAPVDNFPNVVLEALACGTPVVGLAVGGVPEMVRPNVTGWLATAPTAAALGEALTLALAESGPDWRRTCRQGVEKHYLMSHQAHRYGELYRSVTAVSLAS